MIVFTRSAERDLRKLDPPIRQRIATVLKAIESDPIHRGDVKKLSGGNLYRLRVGDYRVVYDVIRGDIVVHLVAHRSDVYRRTRRRGDL